MAEQEWLLVGAAAGLLGFANLDAMRRRRFPNTGQLFFSFTAGYLALRHGSWLWDDEQTQVVAVALVFCPSSLVFGFLVWGTGGAFGRVLIRLAVFGVLAMVGFVLAFALCEFEVAQALRFGLVSGLPAFLPCRSLWRWLRKYRARSDRRREENRRQEQKQQEIDRQRQLEQQQDDLLQALVDELRK